jgi:hypothetical protein
MKRSLLLLSIAGLAGPALAQQHQHDAAEGHDMPSAFGPYTMAREGSGTAWQPENFGMSGLMFETAGWSMMAQGMVNTVYDDQGGPRGDRKSFTSSMAMLMANRPWGPGTLGLRAMLSLDPTIGHSGYPLLFQTGETANGQEHLVDRQHPHDAFMELSGSYAVRWGEDSAGFVYAGLPGEPALGPSTFMHRFSGMRNPEAPITHHWLDSTHITMGVVTLGATRGAWKVEASRFNGREPDQNRWNIETGKLDSSSARVTWNPAPEWSLQASYGKLRSPEQLDPDVDVKRTTASVMHQATVAGMRWGTTLAWGRNDKSGPDGARKTDAWLLESTLEMTPRHTLFGRLEQVENDELLDHHDPRAGEVFTVRKLSVGALYDFARTGPVAWSVGVLGSAYDVPVPLRPDYGSHPTSWMAFLQARF